jgi:iron complex outermembrane receptor protein
MIMKTHRFCIFAAGLLASTSAYAQETPAPPPGTVTATADQETSAGTDIVVTAQRRAERLQDVPIAITAMSGADLKARQINSTLDIVNYVPNLIGHQNTSVGTANAYSLRGLANTESISTFDPPVGTYVDDIYISRQNANNFALFDVERIEVLSGPQGTLFGRNTTGGAINIIMAKPAETLGGDVSVGYGEYHRKELRASVDAPISPNILTKVSGYFINSTGYVHDLTTGQLLNGEKSWGLRGAVRALLSDKVTWDLTGSYTYSSLANFPNFSYPALDERVSYTPFVTTHGLGTGLVSAGLADVALGNTVRSYLLSSNIGIEVTDNLSANIITGYLDMHQHYLTDSYAGLSSASGFNGVNLVNPIRGFSTALADVNWTKQFTQEVKFTGKAFDGLLNYVGGVYYIDEKNSTNFANITVPLTGSATVSADRLMTNDTTAWAGYFQGDLHPTSKLTLTAGIRYTDEDKTIAYSPNANPLNRASALYVPFTTADVAAAGIPVDLHSNVWTPRFAIDYKIDPDLMLFASATKGFKSGGWNSRAYYASAATVFDKETIWSYEAGIRSEWFNHKLKANLTGFYYLDYNIQLPGGALNATTGTITYQTTNVGDQQDYGVEAEFTLTPVKSLNLYWNVGSQFAKYVYINDITRKQQANCLAGIVANNCGIGVITPTGGIAAPNRAPHFTSTLGAVYTWDLNKTLALKPSINWNYMSQNLISSFGAATGVQPGHSLFNAGLTLQSTQGWSLSVDCDNCFNYTYRTSFLIYAYLNTPGTWMARFGYKF